MKIPIFQADAFTHELFKGNPAAVCPLEDWIPDIVMQKVAMENNLSETAFFVKVKDGFRIRWFTPTTEVKLCGHATLATAAVIYEKLDYKLDTIIFHSLSGDLSVKREYSRYVLNFPADNAEVVDLSPELQKALGIAPVEAYEGREDYLLIYENQRQIRELHPDFNALRALTNRGIIVSAPGRDKDFVSRFFAPAVGIDEDPVTGSAHTTLIPYWAEKLGKNNLQARQFSHRTGEITGIYKNNRVEIAGEVIFYLEGIIEVGEWG